MDIILKIINLIIAIVCHEVSHGFMAYAFGDQTAKKAGRLNFNPIAHIDPVGSIILPGLLFITQAPFLIGWAKPVPVNFNNLNPTALGTFFVAAAGPLANVILSIIASILWKTGIIDQSIATTAIQINVILAAFNLLPLLPLDGGRMITCFLPQNHPVLLFFERYGLLVVISLLAFAPNFMQAGIFFTAEKILSFLNNWF